MIIMGDASGSMSGSVQATNRVSLAVVYFGVVLVGP